MRKRQMTKFKGPHRNFTNSTSPRVIPRGPSLPVRPLRHEAKKLVPPRRREFATRAEETTPLTRRSHRPLRDRAVPHFFTTCHSPRQCNDCTALEAPGSFLWSQRLHRRLFDCLCCVHLSQGPSSFIVHSLLILLEGKPGRLRGLRSLLPRLSADVTNPSPRFSFRPSFFSSWDMMEDCRTGYQEILDYANVVTSHGSLMQFFIPSSLPQSRPGWHSGLRWLQRTQLDLLSRFLSPFPFSLPDKPMRKIHFKYASSSSSFFAHLFLSLRKSSFSISPPTSVLSVLVEYSMNRFTSALSFSLRLDFHLYVSEGETHSAFIRVAPFCQSFRSQRELDVMNDSLRGNESIWDMDETQKCQDFYHVRNQ